MLPNIYQPPYVEHIDSDMNNQALSPAAKQEAPVVGTGPERDS